MQDNIIIPPFGFCLKTNPYPTMPLVALGKVNRGNRIGISEEEFVRIFVSWQAFLQELNLMAKHLLEAPFGYITSVLFRPIESVAKILIIGTYCLGYSPRCSSCTKEITHSLLTRPYFRESPIDMFVQIDTQCFSTQGGNFLKIPIPYDISSHM